MDTVTCKHCSRNVVPRLWHKHTDLQKRATQHLFPLCGKVMYVTGGEPNFGGWVFSIVFLCALIYGFVVLIGGMFNPPPAKAPVACKGSAAHCKAAGIKQK